MPTNVFITIDTEHSIGGALRGQGLSPVGNERVIFGRIGGKFYGIPLMMDIADRFGLRLTFFLEVFNHHHFGQGASREVCEYILSRNHEVQLHLHPAYLNFSLPDPSEKKYSDLIGNYDLATQVEFFEEGCCLLEQYGAPRPKAFRAGCFGSNLDTLLALAKTGFAVDCSYNPAYVGKSCLLPEIEGNEVRSWNGIREYPVTGFKEVSYLRASRKMALDINGASFAEIRWLLLHAHAQGLRNVTIIAHSFSFLRSYDVQYRKVKPRKTAIKRFEKLCAFLAEHHGQFNVKTFGEITADDQSVGPEGKSVPLPTMPSHLSVGRLWEQALDRL
jgi:hypothetical protein